jgi:branched-chain amino acid transport system substrate-binding protein
MRWGLAAWLVVALLAGACGRSAEPVRIGVVFSARNSAIAFLAADDINSAGGVRGRPLVIVLDTITETSDQADVEIRRAQSIVRRTRVVGVVGHAGSRVSLVAAPIYNAAEVVHIVPTGTSRLLARAGPWTLTLAPNDSVEGTFIAEFVRDRLRARSVVMLYVNDEYGMGLRDGVRSALSGSDVRLLREQRYDISGDIGTAVDAALRGGAPDVVVVGGRARETGAIARRLRALRVPSRVVAGDGSDVLHDLVTVAGPAAAGIYVTTFWLPGAGADTASERFRRAVSQRFVRPASSQDAMIYDAVRVMAAAVEAVGDDPAAVRRYLLELGRTRPRYRGLTGEIGFGAGAGPPRFVMGVVRGDSIVPVEPTSP